MADAQDQHIDAGNDAAETTFSGSLKGRAYTIADVRRLARKYLAASTSPVGGRDAGDALVDAALRRLASTHGVANLPWPEDVADDALARMRAAFEHDRGGPPDGDDLCALHDAPSASKYAPSWLLACATVEHVGERAVVPSTLCDWINLVDEDKGEGGSGSGSGGGGGGAMPDLSAARPKLAELWRGMCALIDGDAGARAGRPLGAADREGETDADVEDRATDADAHSLCAVAGGTGSGVCLAHLLSERMLRGAVRRLAAELTAALSAGGMGHTTQSALERARADAQVCRSSLRRHVFGPADVADRLKLDAERMARAATAHALRDMTSRISVLEAEKASLRRRGRVPQPQALGRGEEHGAGGGLDDEAPSTETGEWDPSVLFALGDEPSGSADGAETGAGGHGGPSPLSRASSRAAAESAARGASWASDIAARERAVRERASSDPSRRTIDAVDAEIKALRRAHADGLRAAVCDAASQLSLYSSSPLHLFDVSSVRLVDVDTMTLLSANGCGLLRWLRRAAVALRAESLVATSMARVPVDAQDMSTHMVRAAPAYAGDALTPFSARGDTILMLGMCASPTLFGSRPEDVRSLSWGIYERAAELGQAELQAAAAGDDVALVSADDTTMMAAHMTMARGGAGASGREVTEPSPMPPRVGGGPGARRRQEQRRQQQQQDAYVSVQRHGAPVRGVDWLDGMVAALHAAHLNAMYASDASRLRTLLILNLNVAERAVEEAQRRRDADAQRRAGAEHRRAEDLYELMSELCDVEAEVMGRYLGQRHEELIAWLVLMYRQVVRAPTVHLLHLVARSAEARSKMAHLVTEMRQRCAEAGAFRYAARTAAAEYERASARRGAAGDRAGGEGSSEEGLGAAGAAQPTATSVRLRGAGGRPLELHNGRRVVMVGEELGDAMERCVLRDVQFNAAVLAHIAHYGMLDTHRPRTFDDLLEAGLPMPTSSAGRASSADGAVSSWLAVLSALRGMLSAMLRMCASQAKLASGWSDLLEMVQANMEGGGDGDGEESVEQFHDVFLRALAPACDNARIAGVHHAGHLLVAAAAVEQRTAKALYDPLATRIPAPSLVQSWAPSMQSFMQTAHGRRRAEEAADALRQMIAAGGSRQTDMPKRLRALEDLLQRSRGRSYAETAGLSQRTVDACTLIDTQVSALLAAAGPLRDAEGAPDVARSGSTGKTASRRRPPAQRSRASTPQMINYGAEFYEPTAPRGARASSLALAADDTAGARSGHASGNASRGSTLAAAAPAGAGRGGSGGAGAGARRLDTTTPREFDNDAETVEHESDCDDEVDSGSEYEYTTKENTSFSGGRGSQRATTRRGTRRAAAAAAAAPGRAVAAEDDEDEEDGDDDDASEEGDEDEEGDEEGDEVEVEDEDENEDGEEENEDGEEAEVDDASSVGGQEGVAAEDDEAATRERRVRSVSSRKREQRRAVRPSTPSVRAHGSKKRRRAGTSHRAGVGGIGGSVGGRESGGTRSRRAAAVVVSDTDGHSDQSDEDEEEGSADDHTTRGTQVAKPGARARSGKRSRVRQQPRSVGRGRARVSSLSSPSKTITRPGKGVDVSRELPRRRKDADGQSIARAGGYVSPDMADMLERTQEDDGDEFL